jgi:glycosyltransferase involved in cell wall biosynthesis
VTIACGFHGKSGGVTAIANLANMLSSHYAVDFVTNPTSSYNSLFQRSVRMVDRPATDAPVMVCDVACDEEIIRSAKARDQTVIVTCHALANALHGFTPDYVRTKLLSADLVHFVSQIQQDSFNLADGKFRVIPNFTRPIRKTTITHSVGVVGRLTDTVKNTGEAIDVALRSEADCIHLWGGAGDPWFSRHPRVRSHRWTSNKERIYNTFDVLINLSKQETFGMVVIEAMSAGLPCLLSSIPAFEQFRGCPGVRFVDDTTSEQAPQIVNDLLRSKNTLKDDIIVFWNTNFSEIAVSDKWIHAIEEIRGAPRSRRV